MQAIEVGAVFDGRVAIGGAVVLVDGTRIADVLPRGSALPAGCTRQRFPDATLLPGLVDAHVHLCCDSRPGALERIPDHSDAELTAVIEEALAAHLAAGVTAVRDLGDRRWAVLDWRARHRDDRTHPTVVASGPPLTSPGGHCANMGGEVAGVAQLREAVRERARRGADLVKIMVSGGVNTPGSDATRPQFSTGEVRAVVDEARAVGLPVTAHAHSVESIRAALAAGVDGIEHCTLITATGTEVPPDVVTGLRDRDTTVCPTLGFAPGVTPPPAVLEIMRRTGLSYGARARTVGELHRAGVRIVSGSDAGINPGKRHGVLPESVIELVNGGMSAADALASATGLAAAACGLGDRMGRVAPGFDADLLLVAGDPLADIAALRSVEAVYLAGTRRV
jgi:imidazolonepropionase-like amidohydrolase